MTRYSGGGQSKRTLEHKATVRLAVIIGYKCRPPRCHTFASSHRVSSLLGRLSSSTIYPQSPFSYMTMKHSKYLDTAQRGSYRDDGLANGILLRVHRDQYREINGSLRAQQDWNRLVSPVANYHGGLADRFNFVSVTIPGCLPERLEIISYANEYAFLYDGESSSVAKRTRLADGACRSNGKAGFEAGVCIISTVEPHHAQHAPTSSKAVGTICYKSSRKPLQAHTQSLQTPL